jgi:hypothetical protein
VRWRIVAMRELHACRTAACVVTAHTCVTRPVARRVSHVRGDAKRKQSTRVPLKAGDEGPHSRQKTQTRERDMPASTVEGERLVLWPRVPAHMHTREQLQRG